MTVSAQDTVFHHVGNGVTVTFAYNCQVPTAADLNVYVDNVLTTTGFTVAGIGDLTGGTITFAAAPANLAAIRIEREIELERTTDYQQNGDFLSRVVNPDFDRLWMALQGFFSGLNRSLKVPKTDVDPETELPAAADRANKLLSFDADGNPTATAPVEGTATALVLLLATSIGASLIGFLQAGLGAVLRTLQSKASDIVNFADYGVTGLGVADERINAMKAIDAAPDGSTIVFKAGGTYRLTVGSTGPNDWWTEDGEAALDVAYNTALAIRDRRGLTIMAEGATFICDDEYTVTFYKCIDCRWIGGRFIGDPAYKAGILQAAAIVVMRCVNTWVRDVAVETFYRNVWFGRSNWCGAQNCRSEDAGYFPFYASGNLDVALPDQPSFAGVGRTSDTKFIKCIAVGGKYGNFFLENAEWADCESYNAGRQGVASWHVITNNAGFKVMGGIIFEDSDQNSGDVVNGIGVAASGSYVIAGTDGVDGVQIGGGLIIHGCRSQIVVVAASNVTIDNVTGRNFYLSGINAHTRVISGADFDIVNLNIGNNNFGPFNSASTITAASYDSKGAVVVESNDGVAIKKAMISGAVIDGNSGGAIAPTGTWYELKCNDSNVLIGDIQIRGTGTQQRTAKRFAGFADHDIATTGAQVITGVGFKPNKLTVMACFSGAGTDAASHGHVVTVGQARAMYANPTTVNWATTANAVMVMHVDTTNYGQADLTSFDDDGFTLTWTVTGAPTGTVRFSYLAER